MKTILLLLIAVLLALPLVANADQSDLLPQKVTEPLPINPTAAAQEEQPPWGIIVVMLLLGSFLFLFLEIAVIPGFGLTGIIGITLLVAGLAIAFMKLSLGTAIAATTMATVGVVLLLLWFFLIFPKTEMGKMFILQSAASTEEGFVAVDDNSPYIGKEGVTLSMLRPSGIARIDDERVDVMTEGEFVKKGVKIRVTKTRQNSIIVVPIEEEPSA